MSQVKIISVTQPRIDSAIQTGEDLVAYTARVSNPSNQMNVETAPRLLRYLIENKHWSPFEMVHMCVEIKTSRAIAQQILRHRSFSFQEFSQRYAEVVDMEPVQLREQADSNRQSSSDPIHDEMTEEAVSKCINHCKEIYRWLLDSGVAKECARMVLPLTTETTIYMSGSVRSWIHYLQLRCDEHTQLEHRQVALAIQDIFKEEFPTIHEALYGGE